MYCYEYGNCAYAYFCAIVGHKHRLKASQSHETTAHCYVPEAPKYF